MRQNGLSWQEGGCDRWLSFAPRYRSAKYEMSRQGYEQMLRETGLAEWAARLDAEMAIGRK